MSFRDLQPKKPFNPEQFNNSVLLSIDHHENVRRRKIRQRFDRLIKSGITLGGYSVIVTILLIFFFLLVQVWPLMKSATISKVADYDLADNNGQIPVIEPGNKSYLDMEEQGKIAVRFTRQGSMRFFAARTGATIAERTITLPEAANISSFSTDATANLVVYGLNNGQAIIVKHRYKTSYPDNEPVIIPELVYPLGDSAISLDPDGQALSEISIAVNEQTLSIVALTSDRRLLLRRLNLISEPFSLPDSSNFSQEQFTISEQQTSILQLANIERLQSGDKIKFLLLSENQNNLFLLANNALGEDWIYFFRITDSATIELVQGVQVSQKNNPITAASFLSGGISVLLGKQSGEISQWFPVNNAAHGLQLTEIRRFDNQQAPIRTIIPEDSRKGFYAIDAMGQVGIYHATANANLLLQKIVEQALVNAAVAPRANYLLVQDAKNRISLWSVDNEHPEISWSTLWQKIWYESYPEPDFVWQSSSASNDFEPKFSLTPLALGTLKAALYAMLFATPLAIMGAIYTAYFMNARMRSLVKPTIEIMEALPTVIIGFLAGLWLAPLIDDYLPAVLSLFLLLPLGVLFGAWGWHYVAIKNPVQSKANITEGWEALLLIPLIIAIIWLALWLSGPMEQLFFAGDMQAWLSDEMDIGFAQRNAIVIGIAMGFAVIPTIFTITEDAVFNVPGHLTSGSMALGATRWQTLIRVVILTASPAIFSAVMVGFGRAIGETMIVLMATGNTAIMDFSIFQGMRTLSANIAIETPESEVASSHYRVLFLAALILFIFTFFFNTIAEVIRQRLRRNYSKL